MKFVCRMSRGYEGGWPSLVQAMNEDRDLAREVLGKIPEVPNGEACYDPTGPNRRPPRYRITAGGHSVYASIKVLAYFKETGIVTSLPSNPFCGNPRCVNPRHQMESHLPLVLKAESLKRVRQALRDALDEGESTMVLQIADVQSITGGVHDF